MKEARAIDFDPAWDSLLAAAELYAETRSAVGLQKFYEAHQQLVGRLLAYEHEFARQTRPRRGPYRRKMK